MSAMVGHCPGKQPVARRHGRQPRSPYASRPQNGLAPPRPRPHVPTPREAGSWVSRRPHCTKPGETGRRTDFRSRVGVGDVRTSARAWPPRLTCPRLPYPRDVARVGCCRSPRTGPLRGSAGSPPRDATSPRPSRIEKARQRRASAWSTRRGGQFCPTCISSCTRCHCSRCLRIRFSASRYGTAPWRRMISRPSRLWAKSMNCFTSS